MGMLDGKAALVTAAGGGIAGAIARKFAAEGAVVCCVDVNEETVAKTVSDIVAVGGTAIAKLGMAINRTWTNKEGHKQEETTFVDVDAFGRQAEVNGQYLKKGRPVMIEGRLKLDQWDDKQTGQKRSKLRVTGERMQMLPRGENRGGGGGGGSFQDSNPAPPAQSFQQQPQGNQGSQQFQSEPEPMYNPPTSPPPVDDDIPF